MTAPTRTQEPGTLFVVATPIGNLEDITLRALRVLREVAVVAAEDTRRSGNLLRHYGIATPLVSVRQHNEQRMGSRLVERLLAGESVALVTDAGTPGVADPGGRMVRLAREAGVRVDAVPGPSAVTAALSISGLEFDRFAFGGFIPSRANDRNLWFEWARTLADLPIVCYEAPHRLATTLEEMATILVNRKISVARELTKQHEEWLDLGSAAGLDAQVTARGEFVLVVSPITLAPDTRIDDTAIIECFEQSTSRGGRRAAAKAVADKLGLRVNDVYAALERAKTDPQS